jgi:four helix bundle protein
MGDKIKSFTDLNAWKEAHKFVLMVYKATKRFPMEERFGLIDQIHRAVVSITNNIAEGFSRSSSKEKSKFYFTSLGSLTEVQNQLLIARDLNYITQKTFDELAGQSVTVKKLLRGLIKSSKSLS